MTSPHINKQLTVNALHPIQFKMPSNFQNCKLAKN